MESEKSDFVNKMSENWRKMQVKLEMQHPSGHKKKRRKIADVEEMTSQNHEQEVRVLIVAPLHD